MALGNATAPRADGELDLEQLQTLDDELLSEQRGGFTVDGMDISLGAEFRTYLDGELALLTTINWQDGPPERTEWVSAVLSKATAEQLQAGLLNTGSITMKVGDQSVYLANDGQTALAHKTDGGLQNILINTANNANIRQEADLQLDISGYDGFRSDVVSASAIAGISRTVDQGLIGALN
ncbi:hypothetical protein [Stakelama marina]|uniref:Uncharacterized protein n=1 Tax=Stakelama marina TaxID=2826939 RepID=A0A8T4IBB2_9SPHN|nr:hypothetical protein [Stakelama marina]MBR0551850.1 hypothetical protein [Stakelama marina]